MSTARNTLLDFFDDLAHASGEFFVYDDGFRSRSYSYAQVGCAARRFAARLADAGIHKGATVVFWSENRPEWIAAFWGCLLCGVVVVPVDYRSSPDLLARISRIVAATLVLIGKDVPSLPTAFDVPAWAMDGVEWRVGVPPPVVITRDDVAEIIFTSGATGDP